MLEIDSLKFRYPKGDMDFAFNLSVAPGECIGVSGPSGAGKSTLFDLVAGFLASSAGDIRLDGQSILPLPPEDRPVSILFQSDTVFEHLSAGTNVALGLGNRVSASDPRVLEALENMGLPGLANRRCAELSGGQKQRVALARTLLRDRPILLLDEPFTGLDEETALPIRENIASLIADRGWHAILVSHQSSDIAALTQRNVAIEKGRASDVTRPL